MMVRVLAAAAGAVLAVSPAMAAVSAAQPRTVVAALQRLGYRATLDQDSSGDPMVRFRMGAKAAQVLFYGCRGNRGCDSLQLTTGFDLPRGASHAHVNEWVRSHRWVRVYLDEELDPFLQYDIATSPTPLPDPLFATLVKQFRDASEEFARFVDY
jgi:hypothetical protein